MNHLQCLYRLFEHVTQVIKCVCVCVCACACVCVCVCESELQTGYVCVFCYSKSDMYLAMLVAIFIVRFHQHVQTLDHLCKCSQSWLPEFWERSKTQKVKENTFLIRPCSTTVGTLFCMVQVLKKEKEKGNWSFLCFIIYLFIYLFI